MGDRPVEGGVVTGPLPAAVTPDWLGGAMRGALAGILATPITIGVGGGLLLIIAGAHGPWAIWIVALIATFYAAPFWIIAAYTIGVGCWRVAHWLGFRRRVHAIILGAILAAFGWAAAYLVIGTGPRYDNDVLIWALGGAVSGAVAGNQTWRAGYARPAEAAP